MGIPPDERRQRGQPFAYVSVQEDPRRGRDVIGQEELPALEAECEYGALDRARQRDPGGSVVVVGGCSSAGCWRDVGLGPSRVHQDPARRLRRERAEVDAWLAEAKARAQQPWLAARRDVRLRVPRQAEPVGVGEAVAGPRTATAADATQIELLSAGDRQLWPPVEAHALDGRRLRAVVGRRGDEVAHPRLEHTRVPDPDVG